ncbi:MAG: RNA-protein complex protein Nop10 [Candidatus Aenigmarchaeota archaeon]|nr:RNA-protein complex protein Nop10 [Candidatus Aenigmarchaeota archaeon]
MKKCNSCKTYTFKENCPKCGQKTVSPLPPPYSPEDKYGKYRRSLKSKTI